MLEYSSMKDQLIIYTDGGSRGNPGQAACAFVVFKNDLIIFKEAKTIGIATNNIAEYFGVIEAFNWLAKYKPIVSDNEIDSVVFKLDSLLVVNPHLLHTSVIESPSPISTPLAHNFLGHLYVLFIFI